MKTFLPKKSGFKRKWYLIDAEDKTLGHIAAEVATILRGKKRPDFTPHLDTGDGAIIVNAEKVLMTGDKWAQKKYYSHSGYNGGIKEITAEKMLQKKPTEIIQKAVAGMIPKNRLKKEILQRLRIFVGSQHNLSAQKPEILSF